MPVFNTGALVYSREVFVVELRPGSYWIDVPPENGALTVTPDPSRASTVGEGETFSPQTLEVFPDARVVKIRVTVAEVPFSSRAS
jgi:hypothetical protein